MRINEEKILASLYLNLKGKKKKPDNWIEIASNLEKLSNFYGSPERAAEKLGVSNELVSSILRILKLPSAVRDMIAKGEILYDAAQRLQRISDSDKQVEVAKAMIGLTSHQARDLIQYARKYPEANISAYKKRVESSEGKTERINIIVLPVRNETYSLLRRVSRKRKTSVEKLVSEIVSSWLSENEGDKP